MKLQVLYQNDRYVAVHKPAGMLVHRTPLDREDTVFCLQVLRNQLGRHVYPCHRLDKPTSGVLLFALDREALKAAAELFEQKQVKKCYQALVRGWLEGEGRVDHPLRYIPDGGEERGSGKPQEAVSDWSSITRYEVDIPVGAYASARYSLVELYPQTGRRHQLRRHMKHLNHHIIGDTRYGDGSHNRLFREQFSSRRLLLQATAMEFPHPFEDTCVSITSSMDADFLDVLAAPALRQV